jgi:hypothetical protein
MGNYWRACYSLNAMGVAIASRLCCVDGGYSRPSLHVCVALMLFEAIASRLCCVDVIRGHRFTFVLR